MLISNNVTFGAYFEDDMSFFPLLHTIKNLLRRSLGFVNANAELKLK